MILTGSEIARRVASGELVILPFDPARVNPNSYDLRLSTELLVYAKNLPLHEYRRDRWEYRGDPSRAFDDPEPLVEPLDMAVEEATVPLTIPPGGLVLWPGVLYIGSTLEYTESPSIAPRIDGRSSVGRLGLQVHSTAGFGDCGHKGNWTLELSTVVPLRVYAGVAICQIAYGLLHGDKTDYDGKYQGQSGPTPSRLWRDVRPAE